MITVGVDFAAAPRNTAACRLQWGGGEVFVERVDCEVADAAFLALLDGVPPGGRLGIDCPLGWPQAFVAAVRAHAECLPWPAGGCADRSMMLWRETDRWVAKNCGGRWPLSVSTDRIGVTALRAACLLDRWTGTVDRSGMTGPVVEVYPAAARRRWGLGLPDRSVEELERLLPMRFADSEDLRKFERSEHAFDALIAALVARAAALGLTFGPPPESCTLAAIEGWIHVPRGPIHELLAE